jgi:poly [ADP-ribose] polymerase
MTTGTIVEHKKCICVEFGDTNNNKFWEYILYIDGTAETSWGRVGGHITRKPTSVSKALKKWTEKTNSSNTPDKRYTEVKAVDTVETYGTQRVDNTHLADVARKQIKHQNPLVQHLIDYLVKVNAHQITSATGGRIQYDSTTAQFKTPLGVIDPVQVAEARDLLVKIADLVKVSDYNNQAFNTVLNQYLRLIPHAVGMAKISPKLIFPSFSTVQQENDLLDGLETSFTAVTTTPKKKADKKGSVPQIFDVELAIVEDDKILSWVKKVYQATRKANHQSNTLSVKTVYKVDISNMKAAFEKYGATLPDIRQLWHGTKASNLLSILRKGLIIPPANSTHCTGRLYGNGVYFSSISTKALNYATNFWGSGGDTSRTFMFLADVAMGKYYLAGSGWGTYPVSGYHSTWAKGGHSGVVNDEMIVYRLDQANLIYLIEFCSRSQY